MLMIGKIVKQISNDYTVKVKDKLYVCKARGKFRDMKLTPMVGDNVLIDVEKCYIMDIEKRQNSLVRPVIANVDQAVIVMSTTIPSFSLDLLDRLLAIIEFNNIKPIIYVSKLDLLNDSELEIIKTYINYYQNIGYSVYTDLIIKEIFKNKVTVFVGQSGAGKSTLLNKLDSSLNLKTGEVSQALGRGRHTTRHVELIECLDGLIADTPGFSKIDFSEMSKSDIRDNFIEFNNYRDTCEYKDCMHNTETNCSVKDKVNDGTILKSRYDNYLKFIEKR
jgi:ribosome biogenesis GTPase